MIKVGSLWQSVDKKFRVIGVTEIEGHMWVHYRVDCGIKVPTSECKEYSCYEESFVIRFRPLPE
jgi:hypothetical protein